MERTDDRFHEACGIFGIYGDPEAANLTYLGLFALQHRGQESTGIVVSDGHELRSEIGMGLVARVYREERLRALNGNLAIGHNRYSTAGESDLKNAQPVLMGYAHGSLALGHNGNLVNTVQLREELVKRGAVFRSTTDSEVIVHLIAGQQEGSLVDRVASALQSVEGAYSLLVMDQASLIAVRDPHGFRPLCLGQRGAAWVVASETCALDLIGATFVREIQPGELVYIGTDGLASYFPFSVTRTAQCIFEYVYFARPDSTVYGRNVYDVRRRLGQQLAHEAPVDADLVIPVPDSGIPAALGFAEASGLPFNFGLVRSHYVGRTFIEPIQSVRHFGVKLKLNVNRTVLNNKRVIVVDDSIVRGTTSREIVSMIRQAGAREVHLRISSPPTVSPCYYGIDTPTRKELLAAQYGLEEICTFITADSLSYLSLEGMLLATEVEKDRFCVACFTNSYPVPVTSAEENQLSLFQQRGARRNSQTPPE